MKRLDMDFREVYKIYIDQKTYNVILSLNCFFFIVNLAPDFAF